MMPRSRRGADCGIHCRSHPTGGNVSEFTPHWLKRAADISWRLLVVGAAVYFGFQALQRVTVVVLSAILALFPASLMWRPVQSLKRRGWRPLLATWTVMLASIGALAAVAALIIPALADGVSQLSSDLTKAYEDLQNWLVEGPLGLAPAEVERYTDMLVDQFSEQWSSLATGVLSGAGVAIEAVTGFFLALIVVFFILKDGDRVAHKLVARLSPISADRVLRGGRVAWSTLNRYVKGLATVGLVDAVAIGVGLLIVGVPLVVPLSLLVFFGAFFPVVGAFISGLFAVAVTLVNGGTTDALIVLAIVVAVQQLEGDVILPLVFGRTMQLHPLVVLLALAVGGVAFGIVGAFLAVPVAAVVVAVAKELSPDPDRSLIGLAENIH